METKVIPVTGTNYTSPLEERAACVNTRGGYSFYSPINSVEWKNDNIVMKCANNIDIDSDKTNTNNGNTTELWPENLYLNTFFTNKRTISCGDDKPILGIKFVKNNLGRYTTEVTCPVDDEYSFSKVKKMSYQLPTLATFDVKKGTVTNNQYFVQNEWLNKGNYIFSCPKDYYLSEIQGAVSPMNYNNEYHNIHTWTCGTIYNEYVNDDDVYFKWRYYKQDDKLFLKIITNIKLYAEQVDPEVLTYIDDFGQYIDFDININLSDNDITIYAKHDKDTNFEDVTSTFYIVDSSDEIECNFPLTTKSIVQFNFIKDKSINPLDNFDEGMKLTEIPFMFSKIYMVQDTNLPKIYYVTYDIDPHEGGECNGQTRLVISYKENDPIVHPSCTRLGHIASKYYDEFTQKNILDGDPVTHDMLITPDFEAIKYKIIFNNNTSDFEYIDCVGDFSQTASINEVLAQSKIPVCDGEGVTFNDWRTAQNYIAGVNVTRGDMVYNPNVTYPNYKLTFNVPQGVSCKSCMEDRIYNRTKPLGELPIPEKDGEAFDGWYYDTGYTKKVQSTDKLVKDTTIYPKFKTIEWLVNFISPEGTTHIPSSKTRYVENGTRMGTLFPSTVNPPSGYTFEGWYNIDEEDNLGNKYTKNTQIYNNAVLTAVLIDSNGNRYYKKYSEAKANNELEQPSYINPLEPVAPGTSVTPPETTPETSVEVYCPANGSWDRLIAGSTAKIICPTGYTGYITRTCNSDGTWSNINSTACQIKTCPANTSAGISWPLSNYSTSAVSKSCPTGYTGSAKRYCTTSGWSSVNSTACQIKTCPANTSAGISWPSSTYSTNAVSKSCPTGYTGSAKRYCTTSGWSSVNSTACQIKTCPANTSAGISWPLSNYSTSAVSKSCPSGYTGTATRYCTTSGWSSVNSTACQLIQEPEDEDTPSENPSGEDTPSGDTSGEDSSNTSSSDTLSDSTPVIMYCPASTIDSISVPETIAGSTVKVLCDASSSSYISIKCNDDGKWGEMDKSSCEEKKMNIWLIIAIIAGIVIVVMIIFFALFRNNNTPQVIMMSGTGNN